MYTRREGESEGGSVCDREDEMEGEGEGYMAINIWRNRASPQYIHVGAYKMAVSSKESTNSVGCCEIPDSKSDNDLGRSGGVCLSASSENCLVTHPLFCLPFC